jgi:hypothetical protein
MVRFEVEISASVGAFSIKFVPFLMTRTSRKGIALSDSISIGNWMEDLKQSRWLRKFCNCYRP